MNGIRLIGKTTDEKSINERHVGRNFNDTQKSWL